MSIPPLVCSTPPPPDQCEDDKHIDEFDLQYRLSPEDDDENDEYNYGNFSNFNNFPHTVSNIEDSEPQNETYSAKTAHSIETTNNSESTSHEQNCKDKVSFDDVAIEDLNLTVEQETDLVDQVNSINSNDDENSDTYGIACFNPHADSPNKTVCIDTNHVMEDKNEENKVENTESSDFSLFTKIGEDEESATQCVGQSEGNIVENEVPQLKTSECNESIPDLKTSDNFEDFEDFKFTTDSNSNTIESVGNPWESNETDDFTFGDFKVSFDCNESKREELHNNILNNEDEEFGDFDDFKSSVNNESVEEHASPHVTVLNLQSNDNEGQAIESIQNILFDIFKEDLPDSVEALEENIESLLGETWHHLKEVDVRHPYIVSWNNSLGQKTLLKALCIDSRNILFGPKWNSSMPKYATTLSGAPLKPQKPATPTSPQQPDLTGEKSKENITWTDPFTSSGQESNNTDREKTLKDSRPSDLDVFGSSITVSKLDKIHSSTLSVQPLRHINLPDTHIFTPTDSETPRSKTIHYNLRPPVILPQAMAGHSNPEKSTSQTPDMDNNDDYWEFQDFQGTGGVQNEDVKAKETFTPSLNSVQTNAGTSLQSQLLQPVKVEPIMPTLNWPDPGEVKETFDDFSDFISSTNWSNDQSNVVDVKCDLPSSNLKALVSDDVNELKTFQSNSTPAERNKSNNPIHCPLPDTLDIKPDEILTPNIASNKRNMSANIQSNSSPVNSILKPTNAVPSRPQQGQILQPLSLESYSQINWSKTGIDLQNLSSFNPLESLETLKTDSGSSGASKGASPVHKITSVIANDTPDDDIWGDFVSSKPKQAPKKSLPDDDEWTDFVSSPSLSQNNLKTISFNVESNSSNCLQKNNQAVANTNQISLDIPALNYITPKSSSRGMCVDRHFQNL